MRSILNLVLLQSTGGPCYYGLVYNTSLTNIYCYIKYVIYLFIYLIFKIRIMEEHVGKLSIVENETHDDFCTTLVLHNEDHTLGM